MPLLEINNLSKSFGGITAVSDISMNIEKGQIAGLIGPNGAGKTTLFNLLTGMYEPTSGEIVFEHGQKVYLKKMNPYKITSYGISRTFQNIRLFKEMSVMDNVKLGFHHIVRYGLMSSLFRFPAYYREEKDLDCKALELLRIFNLQDKKDELAKNLPYGQQRRLEIVRALAANPSLLLLDEPAAGMNPNETRDLMELIKRIRDSFHLTVLLIEHDMSLVMELCDRVFVLDYGTLIAEGTPWEIQNNQRVIEAYLGRDRQC